MKERGRQREGPEEEPCDQIEITQFGGSPKGQLMRKQTTEA